MYIVTWQNTKGSQVACFFDWNKDKAVAKYFEVSALPDIFGLDLTVKTPDATYSWGCKPTGV